MTDDAMAWVFDDLDALRRQCEAADVESEVWIFYDEDGTWLRPIFPEPPRRGWRRLFGSP